MKQPTHAGNEHEKLQQEIMDLLEERGTETFKKVQEAILEEKIECREIRQALEHFLSYRREGFLVRPTLISLSCEIVGGSLNVISDVPVPLVLMSAGMDIHDDIIDNSKTQNHRPTVLGKFNRDIALLAGDALLFKGLILWQKLAKNLDIEKFIAVTDNLSKAFFEVGDGEALELGLIGRTDVDPEQYLQIVKKKAADIELLMRIGAILGKGSQDEIEALGRYGRFLGMLWILNDDLADMFDFKEMARRVKKGCLPLPVLYALRNSETRDRLQDIISRKEITRKDAETILQMTIDGKGLKQAEKIMKTLASSGLKEVGKLVDPVRLTLLIQGSLVSLQIWEKAKLVRTSH